VQHNRLDDPAGVTATVPQLTAAAAGGGAGRRATSGGGAPRGTVPPRSVTISARKNAHKGHFRDAWGASTADPAASRTRQDIWTSGRSRLGEAGPVWDWLPGPRQGAATWLSRQWRYCPGPSGRRATGLMGASAGRGQASDCPGRRRPAASPASGPGDDQLKSPRERRPSSDLWRLPGSVSIRPGGRCADTGGFGGSAAPVIIWAILVC
jgi:hypothetical protein